MTKIEMLPSEVYEQGTGDRKQYEDRAETYANLTKPSIFRDDSWTSSSDKEDNEVQSYGAMCVNSIVSKIGMSVFPPNASSFRLSIPAEDLQELSDGQEDLKSEIQKEVANGQAKINNHLEELNTRSTVFQLLDHLTVVSSAVVERKPKEGYKIHPLKNFIVKLDDSGEEYVIVVKETLKELPEGVPAPKEEKEEYLLYTMIQRIEKDKWIMTQDVDGEAIGDEKSFNEISRPFVYIGWLWNSGDKYYRPYVEDYVGDLNSVQTFARVLTKGALVSSKSITFVDQRGGRTRIRDVEKANNGDIIQGSGDDVTSYQHGKNYDYQVALSVQDKIEQRLAYAFLMSQGLRRDAERVTAEEIRMISAELENALASVYAVISNKIIKRFVEWSIEDLGIKFESIKVAIVTGLDALGRAVEAQKLDSYMSRAVSLGFDDRVNKEELARRYAQYDNIDSEGLLLTKQEYQTMVQSQQQAAAMQTGTEEFAKATGKNVADASSQQPQGE